MSTLGKDFVVTYETGSLPRVVPVVFKQLLEAEVVAGGGSIVHASCAVDSRGGATLFLGDAHSGKTTTALRLAANGGFVSGDRTLLAEHDGAVFALSSLQDTRVRRSTLDVLGWSRNDLRTRRGPVLGRGEDKMVMSPAELERAGVRTISAGRLERIVVLKGRANGRGSIERRAPSSLRAEFERQQRAPWSPLTVATPSIRSPREALARLPWWSVKWGKTDADPVDFSTMLEQ